MIIRVTWGSGAAARCLPCLFGLGPGPGRALDESRLEVCAWNLRRSRGRCGMSERAAYWRRLLSEWEASGLSQGVG